MSIADKLQTLIDVKEDMKSAIEEKGISVTGDLTSYADAIDQIDPSAVNKIYIQNGTKLAYSSWSDRIPGIGTSYKVPDNFDLSQVVDMSYMFSHAMLTDFSDLENNIIPENITNTSYMFSYTYNLKNVDMSHCSNVSDMSYMFEYTSSSLEIIKLDISNCKSIRGLIYSSYPNYIYLKGKLLDDCDISDALKASGSGPINIYYDKLYNYSRLINAFTNSRYNFKKYDFEQNKVV